MSPPSSQAPVLPGKPHAPEQPGTWGEKTLNNHASVTRDLSYPSGWLTLCHHKHSLFFLHRPQRGLAPCPSRGPASPLCFLEPPLPKLLGRGPEQKLNRCRKCGCSPEACCGHKASWGSSRPVVLLLYSRGGAGVDAPS